MLSEELVNQLNQCDVFTFWIKARENIVDDTPEEDVKRFGELFYECCKRHFPEEVSCLEGIGFKWIYSSFKKEDEDTNSSVICTVPNDGFTAWKVSYRLMNPFSEPLRELESVSYGNTLKEAWNGMNDMLNTKIKDFKKRMNRNLKKKSMLIKNID